MADICQWKHSFQRRICVNLSFKAWNTKSSAVTTRIGLQPLHPPSVEIAIHQTPSPSSLPVFNTMGLSQQHQQGKCVVVGHWKACNNRGRVRQGWMALSCVTSPASLGLLRPICVCTHIHTPTHTVTHTRTHWRAGTRECKGIVNRKHAGLTRDWEVILDRWPLDVFCFCFTLKFLRKAFASAV